MNVACPRCQLTIDCTGSPPGVLQCPRCGQPFASPNEPPIVVSSPRRSSYVAPQRSPGIAAVLSFFWPGVGQIYNGELGKGLVIFFSQFVVGIVAGLFVMGGGIAAGSTGDPYAAMAGFGMAILLGVAVVFMFWVWAIFDAYSTAERLNRRGR